VKARPEIYDNVNVNFRTKLNKEKAWSEISHILGQPDIPLLKKSWKNLRDRFVKVKNARKRHFDSGGDETNAPTYCFYEQLDFIKEFSLKKESDDPSSLLTVNINEPNQNSLGSEGEEYNDYTIQFLSIVQKYPIIYDISLKNDPLRKSKTATAWNEIAASLNNKFSNHNLKTYWHNLVHKYMSREPDQQNPIFEIMQVFEPYLKNEELEMIVPEFLDYSSSNDNEETPETERLEYMISDNGDSIGIQQFKRSPEFPTYSEHCIKKAKSSNFEESLDDTSRIPSTSFNVNDSVEDDFDYFGKKVASQLRSISLRNKRAARMAEIRCLEVLMESEQKLDS
jgi:hypothetical protein